MTLEYETPGIEEPINYALPLALFLACVAAGMAFGTVTSSFNALISTQYFESILRNGARSNRIEAPEIIRATLRGGYFGVGFGIVYTIATAVITRVRCTIILPLRHLLRALLVAASIWFAVGICGMTAVLLAANHQSKPFYGVPVDRAGQIRNGWAAGSLWGAYAAGAVACAVAPASLHRSWKRRRVVQMIGPTST